MTKTEKVDKTLVTIKKLAKKLLEYLKIEGSITVSKNSEDIVSVNIETEESGLLIGRHGETLNSFQHMLALLVYSKIGEWVRLVVDVGDYRQNREETLKNLALRIASEVSLTKQPVRLNYLVPFERRIVHMTLVDHPEVISESEGEGRDRKIVVKPREVQS